MENTQSSTTGRGNERYLSDFVLLTMDSRKEWGSSEDDHMIKKLFVRAELNTSGADVRVAKLVASVHVETEKAVHEAVEVYRIPFPDDVQLRKGILRLVKKNPKFFAV